MKYFIFQGNNHDCGFAALKMLLANLARDKSYLFISKPLKRENYTLDDLSEIAGKYGVELESFGCNDAYYDQIKAPALTLIDQNHVVMIKKVKKKHIVLYDPGIGKVRLKKDDFLARWKQVILESDQDTKPLEIPKTRQNILPKKLRIFEAISALISSAILIGTFYLLNNTENAIFSMVILAIFATAQIVENLIIHREIYHFDKQFIGPYFYQKKNRNKLSYLEFIDFKRKFFTSNRGTIRSFLIGFLIVFLLCLNDFRNIFVLLALSLLKILENLLFSKSEDRVKNKIAECEEKCFDEKNETVEYAQKANEMANTLVLQNSLKSIFYMVLSFIFAMVMMIVTGNSGCNYVIFHFLLYYLGANSLTDIIMSLSNRKEIKKEERRFLDSCNL